MRIINRPYIVETKSPTRNDRRYSDHLLERILDDTKHEHYRVVTVFETIQNCYIIKTAENKPKIVLTYRRPRFSRRFSGSFQNCLAIHTLTWANIITLTYRHTEFPVDFLADVERSKTI